MTKCFPCPWLLMVTPISYSNEWVLIEIYTINILNNEFNHHVKLLRDKIE